MSGSFESGEISFSGLASGDLQMIQTHRLSGHVLSTAIVLAAFTSVSHAGKPVIPAQKPVKDLAAVPLFDAMDAQQVDVKLVHKDESAGNLLVGNQTDQPLNLQLPEAFVGVHVLNQNPFDFVNQNNQSSGQGQGGQSTGGGAASSSQSGGPIFSVPPGKVVRVPVRSVCLEHGRPTPSSRMEYRIFPVERFSRDPALFELLTAVARGKTPQKVAQAAAWHLASDKSWKQLAAMKFRRVGGLPDRPHFRQNELAAARRLVEKSKTLAEQHGDPHHTETVVARREVGVR